MEERKWENLEMDCLVNVLGRVGMESLLLEVPFVCKSWHRASHNPLSWKCLDFPSPFTDCSTNRYLINRFQDVYGIKELSETAFIKFIVDRSCRTATKLLLPSFCTEEALKYAADECPALEVLGLSRDVFCKQFSINAEVIGKLKNLERLVIRITDGLRDHREIDLRYSFAGIAKEDISTIVTSIPKIKYLDLSWTLIDRESLITILQGCKELKYLDVSNCEGFEVDDEILKLASHIATFKYQGSRLGLHLAVPGNIVLPLHLDDPEYDVIQEIIDEDLQEPEYNIVQEIIDEDLREPEYNFIQEMIDDQILEPDSEYNVIQDIIDEDLHEAEYNFLEDNVIQEMIDEVFHEPDSEYNVIQEMIDDDFYDPDSDYNIIQEMIDEDFYGPQY